MLVGYTLGQEVPGLLHPVKITLTRPMPTLAIVEGNSRPPNLSPYLPQAPAILKRMTLTAGAFNGNHFEMCDLDSGVNRTRNSRHFEMRDFDGMHRAIETRDFDGGMSGWTEGTWKQ
ncbi:hypothetical protein B0H13DRAFT_1882353 [Mycena leptocephala]|nr:hypothetical protein B0H13DRAFT_1882353 [Mycena leptocephala]